MEDKIKVIEATKLSMSPGEVLVITIKSSGVKQSDFEQIREGFKLKFPNNDILVMGVAVEDSIEFNVVSAKEAISLNENET